VTREEFANKIRWDIIIWTAGLVNVGAMLPQRRRGLFTSKQVSYLYILFQFKFYLKVQVVFNA